MTERVSLTLSHAVSVTLSLRHVRLSLRHVRLVSQVRLTLSLSSV